MSKFLKFFSINIKFYFCLNFVYASNVTMDLPNNNSESVDENVTNNASNNENTTNTDSNSSLEDEYLNGAPEEDNTALPEDP